MTIGERIKKRRLELGLTQQQLAEKCGMFDSAIRKYESDRQKPKIETLEKIAVALKISPDWIIGKTAFSGNYFPNSDIGGIILEQERPEMIKKYFNLNQEGRKKVEEYIDDISQIKKYQRSIDDQNDY